MSNEGYAGRTLDILARDRARFGAGIVADLPAVVRSTGARAAFVVTDPGVTAAGIAGRVVDLLATDGLRVELFDAVEPNPGTRTVEVASERLRAFGGRSADSGVTVVGLGGGSAMDTAKVTALHATNQRAVMSLGYDDETAIPGLPVIAIPTTAGTGSETNTYGVITDEDAGRKRYPGHPSVLPRLALLDPELTLGLPPAATAATGVDALTHSLESLLSRNPNPFAEALALGVARTVAEWLPRAVDDGRDLEARSRMLLAAHYAGVGQQSGTGVGAVHAIGHALGTRGSLAHGTALATVLPEVLASYLAVRARELALVAVAFGVAHPTDPPEPAARAAIDAIDGLLRRVGQRPTLRELGIDAELEPVIVADAVDDAAIANSPRIPASDEIGAMLAAVRG
ncbi:MAG TPA: iron-containing alcohol dehydrogenase [Candidatus Limnocylindrales bacterium]|nr:iron-containing alcohol dehydrogenase [Candidatus Limnocylindrales bacterium]